MLEQLMKAVLKAFVMLLLAVVFVTGLRFIEYLIEAATGNIFLWDIGVLVLCFFGLVYFCYPKKEKDDAVRS